MYAKMRSKKDEPLSNLKKRTMHVVRKGPLVTPAVPGTKTMRTASPAISVEEIVLPSQRNHAWPSKERRRLIPVRPMFGTMLGSQWKEHMRSSLLRT